MADLSTVASLATAGGTLILAIATFSSTRSANRAARVSERALSIGLRPLLFNARPEDPPQKIGFSDNHWLVLHDGLAAMQQANDNVYMAMPLRNVASGMAVLHGWYPPSMDGDVVGSAEPTAVERFRRVQRDQYVPAGDVSYWQAAVRDQADHLYTPLRRAIDEAERIVIDLLYGDHEGGQRTITRFSLTRRAHPGRDEPWLWTCVTVRHWNLDRADPR